MDFTLKILSSVGLCLCVERQETCLLSDPVRLVSGGVSGVSDGQELSTPLLRPAI